MPDTEFVVEMLGIRKEFPGIVANDDITLCLRKGEVEIDVRYRDGATETAEGLREALRLRHERTLYSLDGTTIDDMAPYFFDEGKPFEEFMNRNSVRPDSFLYGRDHTSAEVRYAVLYFGLSRCVFVTWTDEGVSFRTDDGDICTDFLGQYLD